MSSVNERTRSISFEPPPLVSRQPVGKKGKELQGVDRTIGEWSGSNPLYEGLENIVLENPLYDRGHTVEETSSSPPGKQKTIASKIKKLTQKLIKRLGKLLGKVIFKSGEGKEPKAKTNIQTLEVQQREKGVQRSFIRQGDKFGLTPLDHALVRGEQEKVEQMLNTLLQKDGSLSSKDLQMVQDGLVNRASDKIRTNLLTTGSVGEIKGTDGVLLRDSVFDQLKGDLSRMPLLTKLFEKSFDAALAKKAEKPTIDRAEAQLKDLTALAKKLEAPEQKLPSRLQKFEAPEQKLPSRLQDEVIQSLHNLTKTLDGKAKKLTKLAKKSEELKGLQSKTMEGTKTLKKLAGIQQRRGGRLRYEHALYKMEVNYAKALNKRTLLALEVLLDPEKPIDKLTKLEQEWVKPLLHLVTGKDIDELNPTIEKLMLLQVSSKGATVKMSGNQQAERMGVILEENISKLVGPTLVHFITEFEEDINNANGLVAFELCLPTHAMAVVANKDQGDYRFFDPNHGTFKFSDPHNFSKFIGTFIQILYNKGSEQLVELTETAMAEFKQEFRENLETVLQQGLDPNLALSSGICRALSLDMIKFSLEYPKFVGALDHEKLGLQEFSPLEIGNAFLENGNYKGAHKAFVEGVKHLPPNETLNSLKSMVNETPKKALSHLNKVVKKDPENKEALLLKGLVISKEAILKQHLERGNAFLRNGNYEGAHKAFLEGVKNLPPSKTLNRLKSMVNETPKKALSHLETVLKNDPENREALLLKGLASSKEAFRTAADQRVKATLKQHLERGKALLNDGNYEEASRVFIEGVKQLPTSNRPEKTLDAYELILDGKFDEGISILKEFLKEHPENIGALLLKGVAEAVILRNKARSKQQPSQPKQQAPTSPPP